MIVDGSRNIAYTRDPFGRGEPSKRGVCCAKNSSLWNVIKRSIQSNPSQDKSMKINNTIFLSYLLRPYKAKLLFSNQLASTTEYQILLDVIAHRYKSVAEVALSHVVPNCEISRAPVGGPWPLGDGPSLILDTSIG
jgi:hypothetical protein